MLLPVKIGLNVSVFVRCIMSLNKREGLRELRVSSFQLSHVGDGRRARKNAKVYLSKEKKPRTGLKVHYRTDSGRASTLTGRLKYVRKKDAIASNSAFYGWVVKNHRVEKKRGK